MVTLISIIIFLVAVVAIDVIISYLLKKRLKKIEEEINDLNLEYKEKRKEQQVVYNISSSIFLINQPQEIIKNTLSEITVMYEWPNIDYFPVDEGNDIFKKIKPGVETYQEEKNDLTDYHGIFTVGHKDKLLGVLDCIKVGKDFSKDQLFFFKTVASFLTLALENIQGRQ